MNFLFLHGLSKFVVNIHHRQRYDIFPTIIFSFDNAYSYVSLHRNNPLLGHQSISDLGKKHIWIQKESGLHGWKNSSYKHLPKFDILSWIYNFCIVHVPCLVLNWIIKLWELGSHLSHLVYRNWWRNMVPWFLWSQLWFYLSTWLRALQSPMLRKRSAEYRLAGLQLGHYSGKNAWNLPAYSVCPC